MAKILVLDDEEIIRKSVRRVLEPAGYWVKTSASPKEALSFAGTFSVDVVLSDLKMPEMDGIEFLKRVKEISPQTEVIIITGYGTVPGAVAALRYGAYDYIEKPINPEDLLLTVKRCLERKKLLSENLRLKREVRELYSLENMVGSSAPMQRVFELVSTVAGVDSTVLITGESGTGKELVARAIHFNSPRREGPFMVIDCMTIPESIMESELFGHMKGSFTGADATQKGLIELAGGGTLFFDEIGNLPLQLQAKLLRVLQEKEYRPVGGRQTMAADVRFIAATNRDLFELVRNGEFREDFYYRLNVFPLRVPPLRDRRDDIPALAHHFLKKYSDRTGKDVEFISAQAMRLLMGHNWPGNVRELENAVHRAVVLARSKTIGEREILMEGGEPSAAGVASTPEPLFPHPSPSPKGRGEKAGEPLKSGEQGAKRRGGEGSGDETVDEPEGTRARKTIREEPGLCAPETAEAALVGPEKTKTPKTLTEFLAEKKRLRREAASSLERAFVLEALERNGWNVTRAAGEVGMERTSMHALIRKHGLKEEKE